MALYAIGDLHLHYGSVLKAPGQLHDPIWKKHEEKFRKNCEKMITSDDTLVLVGDHSWGNLKILDDLAPDMTTSMQKDIAAGHQSEIDGLIYEVVRMADQYHVDLPVNLYYKGENGSARKFAEEMESSGIADAIRAEEGNERYEYFAPLDDPETILLIDSWKDQKALDAHHASPMMKQLAELREKYDLHMKVERYISAEEPAGEDRFIRK